MKILHFLKKMNISVILIFCFSSASLGQNVSALDSKYGFKIFKLGTSPSEYQGLISEQETFHSNPKIKSYSYIGNDINNVFNVKTTGIDLTFYENRLVTISISFAYLIYDFKQEDYDRILYSLENLFGEPYNISKDMSDANTTLYDGKKWIGKDVSLELMRLSFNSKQKISGYLAITEENIFKEWMNSEF